MLRVLSYYTFPEIFIISWNVIFFSIYYIVINIALTIWINEAQAIFDRVNHAMKSGRCEIKCGSKAAIIYAYAGKCAYFRESCCQIGSHGRVFYETKARRFPIWQGEGNN